MKLKIIIDTNIYIDLFNQELHKNLINPFQHLTYLVYPVLHELWMGLKGDEEIKRLTAWRDRFIRLQRLILPTIDTIVIIGEACRQLGVTGKIDPIHPKHYNDISIAALARQIGAILVTNNATDFDLIRTVIDFEYQDPQNIIA